MILMIVSYNTLPFLKMAVLSARRHISGPKQVWVWDNGSTDGSAEWAAKNADRVFSGINAVHGHGRALNEMVRECGDEDRILTMDSDVEIIDQINPETCFRRPSRNWAECAYAEFHPLPKVDAEGRKMAPRVNPALAFFRNKVAASHDFVPKWKGDVFYDVGAEHYEALWPGAAGSLKLTQLAVHYGNSTWPANGVTDPKLVARVEANRKRVQVMLRALGYEQ